MGACGKIIFWPQASKEIGTGHLMECLAIADLLRQKKIAFHFIINPYAPAEELLLLKDIQFDVVPFDHINMICQKIKSLSGSCIIVNHWHAEILHLERLKRERFKVVVMDQLGNKTIAADLLINGTIVPDWLKYNFVGRPPVLCFGPDFAILRGEFIDLHRKKKDFTKGKKTILVSMGGVDRSGATFRITDAILRLNGTVTKEIILGKGFVYMDKFLNKYSKIKDPLFTFAQAVNDLGRRMQMADIVISAGGNTLYEMACVGTPGLVLWEDPHENKQGQAFDAAGTVLHIGNGRAASLCKILDGVKALLADVKRRRQMSQNGEKLIDGLGVHRILKEILALNQKNTV